MARRSNVLYEATPFNKPLFMPEEKEENPLIKETPKESSARRKGVLHKVNAHNKAAFMPKEEKKENLFSGVDMGTGQMNNASMARWNAAAAADKKANPWNYASDMDTTQQYMDSTNWLGVSKAENPFSKVNLQNTFSKEGIGNSLKGLGSGMLSGGFGGIASAVGGTIGGLISNGYSSTAGDIMNTVGDVVGMIPGFGTIAGAGLKILSGGVNALFGTKVDQAKLQAANKGTAEYNKFTSNASSFDDIKMATAQANVQDAYSSGILNKGWAEERNKELRRQRAEARSWADRSVINNISNLTADQLNDALANFSAYGGPINRKKKTRRMLTI